MSNLINSLKYVFAVSPYDYISGIMQGMSNRPDTTLDTYGIGDFLGISMNLIIGTCFALSVIFIAFSGLQYSISMGNSKKIETARNALMYSVIALVLALCALAIKWFIFNAIGVTDPNLVSPQPNF